MPRTYKAKRPPVDTNKIKECLQYMIDNHTSLLAAATHFNLPETTVRRHYKASLEEKGVARAGRPPCIPIDTQAELAVIAKTAAAHGFGLAKEELKGLLGGYVQENWDADTNLGMYLRQNCQFNNKIPSDDWLSTFMINHHLSLQKPSPLQRCRKETAADPFIVYQFYDLLGQQLTTLNLHNSPGSIFNLDESAFFVDPKGGKVVAEVGAKSQRVVSGCGRTCFTAMACVSANGRALPPLIVFEGKNMYTSWRGQNALPGSSYGVSG
jgi:hypothetical protein